MGDVWIGTDAAMSVASWAELMNMSSSTSR